MKHIKKRFLIQKDESSIDLEKENFEIKDIKCIDNKEFKANKDSLTYLITTNKIAIGGFVHKEKGKNYIFPVPDLTLIYFHNAQISISKIKENKSVLIDKLDFSTRVSEPAINEIYNFYGVTCAFVIFLFTSIESFINQNIPDSYEYKKVTHKNIEIYNKSQIQENIDFKTKIKCVLKDITGKDFFKYDTPTNQNIWRLKEFRDEIIHTKANGNIVMYDNLIKLALGFNYESALESVAKFMNFYKNDYIVECDCGEDF